MFGKPKQVQAPVAKNRDPAPVQQLQRLAVAYSAAAPEPDETNTCISSGMTVVGKIVGDGTIKIFGRVEGEIKASTVVVADGAHVVGDILADDVAIGGRVKGIVHANRVKLEGSAIVEGDIFHRSLSIAENARFEGSSRREDNAGDKPSSIQISRLQPQPQPQAAAANEAGHKLNGLPNGGTDARAATA